MTEERLVDVGYEDVLAELAVVKEKVEANPEAFLLSTENLRDRDFVLIGKIIQIYCYCDLNARRIIDALREAAKGAQARNASLLQDAQVFEQLRKIVSELEDSDLKVGLLKAASTMEMHRIHRHNFGHWAARRVAGHDCLIIYSKNAKEAERRDGIAQDPYEIKYGIVPLQPLSAEVEKLEGHGQYLALQAAFVEEHQEQFREFFRSKEQTR